MAATRRLIAALALLAATVALAACGSSSNDNSGGSTVGNAKTPAVQKDAAIAAQVPAAVKKKGSLVVASDATYPPVEFIKPGSKNVVGMDADLAKAIGTVMGVKVDVKNATFDGIIPGLAAHKYDLGMSAFTDTKEREQTVDFVTYFNAGTGFFVKAQGGPTINGLADLCGHKVAAEKGTTQVDDATAQSKKCTAANKPAVKVSAFTDQNGANLALSSGRAEVGMADSPVVDYLVKQSSGQFKVSGKTYGTAPYGIAIPKDSGLQKPVLAAVKKLMADGQYDAILKNWGVQSGALSNPGINQATS